LSDRRGLGEILREADLITEQQLEEALRLQKVHGERLASILVRQRVLTEKFAVTYLGRKIGVPAVDLSKFDVNLALFELIPLDVCQRFMVVPIRVEGHRMHLAMSDPLDQKLVAQIEFITGGRITPMVALESSLKSTLLEAKRSMKAAPARVPAAPSAPTAAADGGVATAVAAAPAVLRPAPAPSPPSLDSGPTTPPSRVPLASSPEPSAVFESLAGAVLPVKVPLDSLPRPFELAESILLVDDSEVALKMIEAALAKKGYRVTTARGGRAGLQRVRESMPDLVILDGMLPDVHGFEVCQLIKKDERLRHIPVLILSAIHTGWRFAEDVKQKYGADDYLTKPFEAADLIRRVQSLLKKPQVLPPQANEAAHKHLKDGVDHFQAERLEEAIAAYQKGLAVNAWSDLLHYYLAMALEKDGRVFEAIHHYEKAIQINPQFYDAITALANLYQRQEFWRKSREMWELALDATNDPAVKARIKEHILSLL
jgi:CheY-like chemotaxis protein